MVIFLFIILCVCFGPVACALIPLALGTVVIHWLLNDILNPNKWRKK